MSDWRAPRRYYDRIGRGQDSQRFYEDPPTDRLRECAEFEAADSVVELGCGTGRFARTLLRAHLPAAAGYRGFELSGRMAGIAGSHLRPWVGRASVTRIDGDPPLSLDDGEADRFVANYVLDLMVRDEARLWLEEAHRILAPAGLLCLLDRNQWTVLHHEVLTAWSVSSEVVVAKRP